MKHENTFKKACDYQDKLEKNKILVALWIFDNDTDVEIISFMTRFERDNDVYKLIGEDKGYVPNLCVFDVDTYKIKVVWTYEKGWK